MKRKTIMACLAGYFLAMLLVIIPTSNRAYADPIKLEPNEFQKKVSVLVLSILEKYHYEKIKLDDSLSSIIFDQYIQGFDNNKLYFYQSDIDGFEKYRFELDDAILVGNLDPAYEIFNVFYDRYKTRTQFALDLIQKDVNYNKYEELELDRDNRSYARSKKELDEFWRKYIKNEKIKRVLNGTEPDKINEYTAKYFENLLEWIDKMNSEDVFQYYMNAITESFDPHTSYFLPVSFDNFMINMSQSLEGIGARLQTENEYTKVSEIMPGGPAFKSKKLFAEDRIIAVAQGEDGEWVDIIGWRIDAVVQKIRGPKGTTVRLKILKAEDGNNPAPVEIVLVRDKIKIEEAAPTKEVMTIYKGSKPYRVGVITVPSFYLDFEGARSGLEDYKSTTRDVKKLLAELEEENIDGLLIDLRNNGGGSLAEAIELTGLFIPDGPVVQIKNMNGRVDVQKDNDKNMYYDGPMGVLINRFSASASEIFSGAIQDYKRGVIIGEQSFGKGTVQNMIDLESFMKDEEDKPGQVKITLAKFYRITGSSTQLKGIEPDIHLPSRFDDGEFGESGYLRALPWDQISTANFKAMNYVDNITLGKLEQMHINREKDSPYMLELVNQVEDFKKMKEKTTVSLNLDQRKTEQEEEEKLKADREKLYGSLKQTEGDEVEFKGSEVDDPYLLEGLNVIADWLSFRIG